MAATVTTASSDQDELVRLLREAIHLGAALIVLPELAFAENGVVADLREGVESGAALVSALRLELTNTTAIAVISIVEETLEGFAHTAIAFSAVGEVLRQRALHPSARHPWATVLTSELSHADTAIGRLALLPGEDTLYPEAFRLAALRDVEIVACPMHVVEQWETRTGLPERAAENRFSVVAASRRTPAGASLIATVGEDFTLWTVWKNRPFDGNINYPILTKAVADGVTTATIYPANAGNRTVTQKTDVVDSRPFRLLGPMVN